jgi:replicative DNA helicase
VVNRDRSEICRFHYRDSKYAKTNEIPKVFINIDRFGPLDQVSIDIAKQLQDFEYAK